MTRYADIPKPIRSGIVVVDPDRGTPQRIIVLQFNPDTLERSLAPVRRREWRLRRRRQRDRGP
jgi:hypothetical protein